MANWIDDLADDLRRIAAGTHHDPHGVLGLRKRGTRSTLIAYLPAARSASIDGRLDLARVPGSDFFAWQGPPNDGLPHHYRLCWRDSQNAPQERIDPYSFLPTIGARDLTAFSGGYEARAWQFLGAQPLQVDGVDGVRFALWAPNAERVSVVGPFCDWDGRRLPMRTLGGSGVWELFVPGLRAGELYKFELRHRTTGAVVLKSDPYGRASEFRPGTASIVCDSRYEWGDGAWLRARRERDWLHAPMSIYEMHAGSWRQHGDGGFYSYRELAAELIPYVRAQGFTHAISVIALPNDHMIRLHESVGWAAREREAVIDEHRPAALPEHDLRVAVAVADHELGIGPGLVPCVRVARPVLDVVLHEQARLDAVAVDRERLHGDGADGKDEIAVGARGDLRASRDDDEALLRRAVRPERRRHIVGDRPGGNTGG